MRRAVCNFGMICEGELPLLLKPPTRAALLITLRTAGLHAWSESTWNQAGMGPCSVEGSLSTDGGQVFIAACNKSVSSRAQPYIPCCLFAPSGELPQPDEGVAHAGLGCPRDALCTRSSNRSCITLGDCRSVIWGIGDDGGERRLRWSASSGVGMRQNCLACSPTSSGCKSKVHIPAFRIQGRPRPRCSIECGVIRAAGDMSEIDRRFERPGK